MISHMRRSERETRDPKIDWELGLETFITRLNPRGRCPRRAARGGSIGAGIFVIALSKTTWCLPLTKLISVVSMSFLQGKRRVTFARNRQNVCQTGARKLLRFFDKNHVFLGPPTSLMLLQIEAAPEHLQIHQYLTAWTEQT